MTVNVNLKKQVDTPVWEWCKFCPVLTNATTVSCSAASKGNTKIYVLFTNVLYVYDTITDAWQQLASPPVAALTTASMKLNISDGYNGQVLGAGANTLTIPGLYGQRLTGNTIRIISGTGAGQERTINNVAERVVAEYGTHQAANSTTVITDSSKSWAINQWRGYQVRIDFGQGQGQCRNIISNTATTLVLQDATNDIYYDNQWGGQLAIGTGASGLCQYNIESNVVTVDTNWTIQPDSSSRFLVRTGGLWLLSSSAAAPWLTLQYYDIAADAWYTMSGNLALGYIAALGTDCALERISMKDGPFLTGIATGGGTKTLTETSKGMIPNRYANFMLRITAGAGLGDERVITSNTADTFTVDMPFSASPDITTEYSIFGDTDKLWHYGGAKGSIQYYSKSADLHAQGRMIDWGNVRTLSAARKGNRALNLASITRSGTTATATCSLGHDFKTGDLITVRGATDALYNVTNAAITVTSATAFTYIMSGTPGASASASVALAANVLVDASKAWTINEWAGKVLVVIPTNAGVVQACLITSNTATSITTTANMLVTPAVSNKYYIMEPKAFGEWDSGVSTGQTATVLTDSTKTWKTNSLIGKTLKFITNVGAGGAGTGTPFVGMEATITANTSNTITVATMTNYPNFGVAYSILDAAPTGAGTELHWLWGTSDNDTKGNYLFATRGGATASLYFYDLTTNKWKQLAYFPQSEPFTTGSMFIYDGRNKIYYTRDATGRVGYLDILTMSTSPLGIVPYGMGTAVGGNRMNVIQTDDGLKFLYIMRHSSNEMWRILDWMTG